MAVSSSPPPYAGIFVDLAETYAAGTTAATAVSEHVRTGISGSTYGTALTTVAGAANSAIVQANFTLTFAASTPQTIDLKAVPSIGGNKVFTTVHFISIKDLSTAGAGSVVVSVTGTNAWTNGPFNATGETIAKADQWCKWLGALAGWLVASNNKIITFTPSAHVTSLEIVIFGE